MTPEQAAALRAPFPPEVIGKLPKAGTTLDYVGHAATTDRLLQVDPDWTWEPPTADELQRLPGGDGMWIKLTVCGVTRFGWGDGKNVKEWISDAIRNAAMRFGVALDLWSKEDLSALSENAEARTVGGLALRGDAGGSTPPLASAPSPAPAEPTESAGPDPNGAGISKNKLQRIKSRIGALPNQNVVWQRATEWNLPNPGACNAEQLELWGSLLATLEPLPADA